MYSSNYFDILEKRQTLPVWEQKEDFLKKFKENQVMVLEGETGSGKTTQVSMIKIILLMIKFVNSFIYNRFLNLLLNQD